MKKKILISLAALFSVLLALTLWLVKAEKRRAAAYTEAVRLSGAGESDEAYRIFLSLKGYRDAPARAEALVRSDLRLPFRSAEKGGIVTLGTFEQDDHEENGPEPIEWIVLDRVGGRLLLLSAACLAPMPYNSVSFEPVTWEHSTLRQWLNGEFFSLAFSAREQELIPCVMNENPDHSLVETDGGRYTYDRVFLLCERDTVIYLNDEQEQMSLGRAQPTEKCLAQGLETDEEGYACWWLRSPGMYEYIAQFVDTNGAPYINGACTDISTLCGVRPALWVDAGQQAEGAQQ